MPGCPFPQRTTLVQADIYGPLRSALRLPHFPSRQEFVMSHPTSAQPTHDRDAQGRFAAGNRGGPGNPFARQVAALRSTLIGCVTHEDIMAVAYTLLERAKAGDVAAAKL